MMRENLIQTYVALRQQVSRLGDAPIDDRWSPDDNPYIRAQRDARALRAALTPEEAAEAERRFSRWFRTYLLS